jgi:hypothetical protein
LLEKVGTFLKHGRLYDRGRQVAPDDPTIVAIVMEFVVGISLVIDFYGCAAVKVSASKRKMLVNLRKRARRTAGQEAVGFCRSFSSCPFLIIWALLDNAAIRVETFQRCRTDEVTIQRTLCASAYIAARRCFGSRLRCQLKASNIVSRDAPRLPDIAGPDRGWPRRWWACMRYGQPLDLSSFSVPGRLLALVTGPSAHGGRYEQ